MNGVIPKYVPRFTMSEDEQFATDTVTGKHYRARCGERCAVCDLQHIPDESCCAELACIDSERKSGIEACWEEIE